MMDGTGVALVRGAPLTDGPAELAPASSDVVVTKTRFSGFWGSRLHEVLRTRNIDTLILTGGTTTVCVESTLRDAVFLDYNAVLFSDCTRDITQELHEAALERTDLFFGWVCDSKAFNGALQTLAG
jgi:ureidoacrylate peracid hydrolase